MTDVTPSPSTTLDENSAALLAAVQAEGTGSSLDVPRLATMATGLLPDGSHPATPGIVPLYSAPAPQEAPTKGTKAVWGAVASGVVTAATSFQSQIAAGANPADWTVWVNVLVAGLVGAGIIGGTVYSLKNTPK